MSCAGCWKCCIITCQNGKNTEDSYSFARCCRVSFVQFCKWIPVWLLWTILAWSYYVYVYLLCIESMQAVYEKVSYLAVYHFLLFLLMWSYVRTIYTDISVIPNEFYLTDDQVTELRNETNRTTRKSMLQNLASTHEFQTSTKDGDARYCEKCQCLKPDRCHHCSICRTCVLKMDHHCPWTNNCVGFYNYKFFLLMVIYAVVWCTFIAATTARFSAEIFMKNKRMTYTHASIVILEFTSIAFAIVNVCLLVYHLCLIRHNTTTIETFFPTVFKNVGSHASFNWGCGYNIEQIFGKRKSLWFIPVFTSLGDGVKFPVARSIEDGSDVINEPSSVIAE